MKMRLIIKDATVAELLVTSGFLFPEYPLPVKFPSYEPSGTLRKSVDAPLSPLQEEFEQLLFEKPYEASLRLKKITIDTGSITFEKEDTGPWQESWLKQIKQRVSQLVPGTEFISARPAQHHQQNGGYMRNIPFRTSMNEY